MGDKENRKILHMVKFLQSEMKQISDYLDDFVQDLDLEEKPKQGGE